MDKHHFKDTIFNLMYLHWVVDRCMSTVSSCFLHSFSEAKLVLVVQSVGLLGVSVDHVSQFSL